MPQSSWGSPYTQSPRRTGRALIIVVVSILGSVALLATLADAVRPPKYENSSQQEESQRPDRQVAFLQRPDSGPAARYGGTPMYDACGMLPLADLAKYGLQADVTRPLLHHYLDGDTRDVVQQSYADEPGTCLYPLVGGGFAGVTVSQVPFKQPREVEQLTPPPDEAGDGQLTTDRGLHVAAYRDPRDGYWITSVAKPGMFVRVQLKPAKNGPPVDGREVAESLRKPVADKVLAGPAAPLRPGWTGAYATGKNPCDLVSAQTFQTAFGQPLAPRAQAKYQLSDSAMHEFDNSTSYRTESECRRDANVPEGAIGNDFNAITVRLSHWDTQRGATTRQNSQCREAIVGKPIPVGLPVGDGPVCAVRIGHSYQLHFQVGRYTVELHTHRAFSELDPEMRRLGPIAQEVARQLR